MIVLENVTIQIGQQRFFENTSLRLERGEHWAIIGSSGSGKTILAKAICKKERIIEGKIRYFLDDTDLHTPGQSTFKAGEILIFSSETHHAFLRKFAAYHQARWQSIEGDNVPSVATVLSFQNVALGSYPEAEFNARKLEIIQLLNLDQLAEKKVSSLSHGESRKVFMARLLLYNPKLLILDEPMTGLDNDSRASLSGFISEILKTKRPQLLYLSNNPGEIPEGIQKIAVIDHHRLIRQGNRDEILATGNEHGFPDKAKASLDCPGPDDIFSKVVVSYSQYPGGRGVFSEPVIEMDNVSVQYDRTVLLRNVTWTVRQGERWALLGPNGAGKSTLLSLILGDNPQAYLNKISLFGRMRGSGESIWEIKRKIGWVSPELHIYYPRLVSSMEVILSGFFDSVGLFRASTAKQKNTAQSWIEALEFEELANREFWSLSAGQQRLILLARALVKNPPLLILDEPCQGLDAVQTRKFVGMVDQICDRLPVSLIYVTHVRAEIPSAITHMIRLNQGTAVISKLVSS